MSCPVRTYPLRKPANRPIPIPKYQLLFGSDPSHVYTAYIGLQQHSSDQTTSEAKDQIASDIETWIQAEDGPSASELLTLIGGNEQEDTLIWVCYWLDAEKFRRSLELLSLSSIYERLGESGRDSVGIWSETFTTPISRLETTYSGPDYLPGLGGLPDTRAEEHFFSAYWGAARDRIPDAAHDLFPRTESAVPPLSPPHGIKQHLVGTNPNNLVHIRSGQLWEDSPQDETDAYEKKLEPSLHQGLKHLWENQQETGAVGIRYLRNQDRHPSSTSRPPRKETCGAGFFSSLDKLEKWAKTHTLHLAIYRGALQHYKEFDDTRKLRTWHEVSVLREGDAKFEYINCVPSTGVIESIPLEVRRNLSDKE
ncbi:heme-containing dehydratase protein [Xylariaceae sp. AK1471]|nr:heme-containing dehydratase protein [Xylariaceae sp. AK1471]